VAERWPAGDDLAPLFAALGDPTRLELVRRLGDGRQRSIRELSEGLPQTRQAVTRHLTVLAGVGVVGDHRVGREHLYVLRPAALRPARDWLDRAGAQWDDALGRLSRFLDDHPGDDTP
jgi:DNA-binding transcriptional ArsR family regulator